MDTEKKKVAVIGALNVDIGALADGPLARGDSVTGKVRFTLGGVRWNIARNCALLGAETGFYSLLGRDEHAGTIRAESERYCVDIAGCRWDDTANNRYVYVCDENGDVAAAVNDMRLCRRIDRAFAESCLPALEQCDAVVMEANLPAETLAFLAGRLSVPLVADGVSTAKCLRLKGILDRLHILKANIQEAETLTGEKGPENCIRALLAAGVKRVVVSIGPGGVICGDGERIFPQPSVHTDVVDATGAGDSMTAALTVGLAGGMSFADCAALGVTAAGITVGHAGSVTSALSVLRPY